MRFIEVKNEVCLERELDQIYIGNRKLHVNISKYRRHQFGTKRGEWRAPWEQHKESQKEVRKRHPKVAEPRGKQRSKEIWVEKKGNRSFAGSKRVSREVEGTIV